MWMSCFHACAVFCHFMEKFVWHKGLDVMLRSSPDMLHRACNLPLIGMEWCSRLACLVLLLFFFFNLFCVWVLLFGNSWRTWQKYQCLFVPSYEGLVCDKLDLIEACVLSDDMAASPLSDSCFRQQSGLMAQRHNEINSSCRYCNVWFQHIMLCIGVSSHKSHFMLCKVKFITMYCCKWCAF